MRRVVIAAAIVFSLSASSAQASWLVSPERSRVVKVVKRFITAVLGDGLSEPKP